jgi:hypothetical protein
MSFKPIDALDAGTALLVALQEVGVKTLLSHRSAAAPFLDMKSKIHRGHVTALLTLVGSFALCTAAASTFTFKSGAKFEGELVEAKGTNSVIVRSAKDGKAYIITVSDLTDEDQLTIRFAMRWGVVGQTGAAVHDDQPGLPTTHEDYKAALRAEREKAEAGKTLPEQAGDKSSDSGQITGAFGLKLGQSFDVRYATYTNNLFDHMTLKGDYIRVEVVSYSFKPRVPLMQFELYSAEVTPCSNLVYSITALADYESYSSASEDQEKLLAALEQKYGRATLDHSDNHFWYTIKQGTRQVSLSFGHPTNSTPFLTLTYEDTALHQQANFEQAQIDALDPKRKAEQNKLKKQL